MEELGSQAEAQSSLRLVPVPGGQCSVGSKKGPRDWTDPELARALPSGGCNPRAVAHRGGDHLLSVLCF